MTAPVAYSSLALLFAAIAGALVALAVLGSYTKRVTVPGQLVPNKGLLKVYVQQLGTVVEDHVTEGQRVQAGQVLFVLSSERQSSTLGETQAAISQDTEERESSLRDQLAKTVQLQRLEHTSLVRKIDGFRNELLTLRTLSSDQKRRYELALADLARYRGIEDKGYVTQDQVTQRQGDVIDQKSRLDTLGREQLATERDLADAQYQFDALAIKYDNQIGDIRRNIASAEQDLSESEARRRLIVVAPSAGTATAVTVHLGQVVDTSKPLVSIVPDGSQLEAELYAPSKAIGFVHTGDTVHMRYQAFPYQKFGQYRGTILDIASTALSSAELTDTNAFSTTGNQPSEPLYRISIALQGQAVVAYGKTHDLSPGMLLDADLLQEKRRLYEWVLEPLLTVSGKL